MISDKNRLKVNPLNEERERGQEKSSLLLKTQTFFKMWKGKKKEKLE